MDSSASAARARAGSSTQALDVSNDSSLKPSATDTATPEQDLWSSILNSVNNSKAISAKNLILLGEPKSGKTTLLSALASTSPVGLISGRSYLPALDPSNAASTSKSSIASRNLGLAYAYFDVGDEKDRDEIVARVGAYTLHSSEPAYTSLLPCAFPEPNLGSSEKEASSVMAALASATLSGSASASSAPSNRAFASKPSIESLKDSIVVILLDWEQPWTFLEQLRNWLSVLHELVDGAADGALSSQEQRDAKWSKTRAALDEMKERLEAYIRAYVEPAQKSTESSSVATTSQADGSATSPQTDTMPAPITTVSVQLDGADANPLAEGTLTDNLGIPIVIVCTKADAIPRLERDKDFKEEQFDYIQQVLRTICMRYGAALFYTSSTRAQSIDILRSYLLHRLFTPSIASSQQPQQQSNGATAQNSAAAGGVASFGFPYRASTTDRDTLLVPAGWDSWGKIKALRETFDSRSMTRGWDTDCEIERLRRSRNLPKTKEVEDQLEKEVQANQRGDVSSEANGGDEVQSAMKLYEDIVADWEAAPAGKDTANKVRIPDEQTFLGQHHATLQKEPDPKSKFSKRGVVGPMTGSSAGLPSVEKYMSRDGKSDTASAAASGQTEPATPATRPRLESSNSSSKRESTSAAAAAAVAAMTSSSDRSSRPTSPAVNSGTTSPGAPKQSEVLHSFFQSLLQKDKGVGSPKVDRLRTTSTATPRKDPPSSTKQ
ncbi:Dynein family light intermediate chain [Kalmanozyma brasiliensis GHG001]|uniref:Dynein light intermediate chain n=1 Tax=Kalmanozyma brasiliensis (strain GHG001) TaxID=1365824 RepID=V5GU97_KALBG|nr:Dynein family light intermediate chain [Kalmanozyma brasiliensis GHG001]EST09482.1 Dynein family light intermediate chain [Kalmanozyma brasiliensis GHG001]